MSGTRTDSIPMTSSKSRATSGQPAGVRIRYFNVYRLATYCLVVYTLGHTLGAVVATPRFGPESDRVVSMMKSVHVIVQGTNCTWYGFYLGFGWMVSVFFALSAVITWHLGGRATSDRVVLVPISISVFLSHVVGCVLAWVYFFPAPRIFSTAIAGLLGVGCLQDWNASHKSDHQVPAQAAGEASNG
jgi:hypothetical protein